MALNHFICPSRSSEHFSCLPGLAARRRGGAVGSLCSLPGQRAWKRAVGCSARGRLTPGGPGLTKRLELHQHVHRYPGDVMSSANPQSGVIFCHWDNTEGKQTWTTTSSFAQNYLIPEKQVNNARQLGISLLLLNSLHNS